MKYILSQFVWRERDGYFRWEAPDIVNDSVLDLRSVADCSKILNPQGYALIATERNLRPKETLVASTSNELLTNVAKDAVKDKLQLPENLTVQTVPELIGSLLGVYADPSVGICRPVMPDKEGNIRFKLGEVSHTTKCPTSGTQWDNILRELQFGYREVKNQSTNDIHRKYLSTLQRKLGVENYEIFIPSDLPKETPVRPTTTLRDNFDVGNHADISGQASSDGWLWNKIVGAALALIRTDTQVYAECQSIGQRVTYRADSDLSSTDHYVQAGMMTSSNGMTPVIMARKDGTATVTWYELQLGAGSQQLFLLKVIAGVGTVISNPGMTIALNTFYTVKLNITGSTLQLFNGGTQVGTDYTDTAVSTGLRCGMTAQGNSGVITFGGLEDWEASDGIAASRPRAQVIFY